MKQAEPSNRDEDRDPLDLPRSKGTHARAEVVDRHDRSRWDGDVVGAGDVNLHFVRIGVAFQEKALLDLCANLRRGLGSDALAVRKPKILDRLAVLRAVP